MKRLHIALSALVVATGVVMVGTPVAAVAETATLSATCEMSIFDNGEEAPPLQASGSFQILGTAPATSRVGDPLVLSGVQVRLSVDWNVLGPELRARGVTHLSGGLLAAWLDVTMNGVQDWPTPIAEFTTATTYPVEQLGTGIMSHVHDIDMGRLSAPALMRLANYGPIYFELHKYEAPQVALFITCTPTAGQDMTFGEVTIQS